MIRKLLTAALIAIPGVALALGFPSGFGLLSSTGGPYTLLGVSTSGTQYVESAAGSFVIGSVVVSTSGTTAGTIVLSLTGTNAQGFRLSSTSLPANLICPSGGCPSGAGPYTDVNIVATDSSAIGSPVSVSPSLSGSTGQITAVSTPSSYTFSAAASSVIGAITPTIVGTASSIVYTITGTNSGGFAISGSNLICNASTGCPSSGNYADFNVVATQSGIIGSPFVQAVSLTGTMAYTGPGNVGATSGAVAWWGMRAWSTSVANTGGLLFNARNGTTAETCDFKAATNGGVGIAANCSGSSNGVSLSTFQASNTLFLTKFYDQTGNGHDSSQATTGNQPTIIVSCFNSLPCISQVATYTGATITSIATPYTLEMVAGRTSGSSATQAILQTTSVSTYFDTGNTFKVSNGTSVISATQGNGFIHELVGSYAAGGNLAWVDGASAGGVSTAPSSGTTVYIGGSANTDTIHFFEGGWFSSAIAGSSSCHNPYLYWGLPNAC